MWLGVVPAPPQRLHLQSWWIPAPTSEMQSMRNHDIATIDITKDYGAGPVLGGVSLDIPAGQQVAVMGPSGSGKSTLLHCLSGVMTPSTGQIQYGDTDLGSLGDKGRSQLRLEKFGFVFQDGQLLPELTAAENVALPARLAGQTRGRAEDNARETLGQVGLGDLTDRRPGQLSGGQAQRVAIARALAGNPTVLFADEPTGSLDQATGHEIIQLLTAVVTRSGASLVVVTHDASVANWCQRRVEIRDGIVHDDRMVR